MGQQFKDQESEEKENDFNAGFKVPDTKSIQQRALAAQHDLQREDEEEKEKQGKPQKKRQKPKKTSICFCGHPTCSIGPFVETQGE